MSNVSATEIGVSWTAPSYTGGNAISEFLIEWDTDEYFNNYLSSSYRAVVTAADAETDIKNNDLAYYSYQITGLTADTEYFVRVSGFNGDSSTGYGGYSAQAAGFPINSTDCNTYPTHCGNTPSAQLLYKVMNATVSLSASEVANRPRSGRSLGTTSLGSILQLLVPTHQKWLHYRIEWSTNQNFANSTYYDMRTVTGDGVDVSCEQVTLESNPCNYVIGQSVQNITIASGNGDLSGRWKLPPRLCRKAERQPVRGRPEGQQRNLCLLGRFVSHHLCG